jgi:deazaflavin-dependent oxidoreductase (nitroreductase family)
MRLMVRAPVWLYRAGLGGLLGRRLLMLTHRGRVSGQLRRTVLEVAGHDPATGAWVVASGFGTRSQWLRNIDAHPDVRVRWGWHREVDATAHRLPPPAAGAAMVDYARRHPRAARSLMRVCGLQVDRSTEDYQIVGEHYIPFVSLTPRRRDR